MEEEKWWKSHYRFEVKDEDGAVLDSDLVKGKTDTVKRAKTSLEIVKGCSWVIFNFENEPIKVSDPPDLSPALR